MLNFAETLATITAISAVENNTPVPNALVRQMTGAVLSERTMSLTEAEIQTIIANRSR